MDNYYDFMKDEILIRVESLKIELEDLYTKFCSKIDDRKLETQKNLEKLKDEIDINLNLAKDFLKSLGASSKSDFENQMYLCDEIGINLEKLDTDLIKCIQNFKFKPNAESINDNLIGDLTDANDVTIQQENGFLNFIYLFLSIFLYL